MYYVYILLCGDGSLYTGTTNDVKKRLAAHEEGKGAKYTRGRRPLTLVYTEAHPNKQQALRREAALKKMRRAKKLELIQTSNLVSPPDGAGHAPL